MHDQKPDLPDFEAENLKLVNAIRAGDGDSRELLGRLWTLNQRLVWKMARRYSEATGAEQEDLAQQGFFALREAVLHYDPGQGMTFGSYLFLWLRAVLARYAANARLVRLPEHTAHRLQELRGKREAWTQEHGREPDAETLATLCGCDREQIERLRVLEIATKTVASLDKPLTADQGEETTLADFLQPSEAADAEVLDTMEQETLVVHLWSWVNEIDQTGIMIMRWRQGLSFDQISQKTGMSLETAKRKEREAMKMLRNPKNQRQLLPYLPEVWRSAAKA